MAEITGSIDEKKRTLTIVYPLLPKPEISKTGKNKLIMSTGGNKPVKGLMFEGKEVTIGGFAYVKNSGAEA